MDVQPFLIDNAWVTGGGEPFVSTNPADGSDLAMVGGADASDVDAAVSAAKAALENPEWRDLKPHERALLLHRIGELLDSDTENLARLQMRDNGKTMRECRAMVGKAAASFRYFAAVCETFEGELPAPRGNNWPVTVYEPVGVVGAITPWNSPLTLEAQKLAPVLAAGNAIVLKPSEVTPLIALEHARIAVEAGLPPGVVNVVSGGGDIGRALVGHAGVDMISFTGGTKTGSAIAAEAGRLLKPVMLELGGKSPNIVFADADLAKAVEGAGLGIFSGGGQSCTAGSRIFVDEAILDEFVDGLRAFAQNFRFGPPENEDTDSGPLASFAHRDRVDELVEIGRGEGAHVLTGGARPGDGILAKGAYYPATILTGLDNRARISQEEIFGPVAVILPFKGEDDLIDQANDTVYGLAAGVWTCDYRRAWRVARAIRAGTVWINTYRQSAITSPFGGFKQSGLGREKGLQGMRTYMEPKAIYWSMD